MGVIEENRMMLHRTIRRVFAACSLLGALWSGQAAAEPSQLAALTPGDRRVTLDYAVYIGGFRTIDIAFDARIGRGDYRLKMDLTAEGLLNWVLEWSMSAYSEGRFGDKGVIPVRAGHDSRWRGNMRRIRLDYRGGGPPVTEIVPPPDEDDRRPVPVEARTGARDLAGAVLSTLFTVGATNGCTHSEPVFDGRRRFDLVFEQVGRERFVPGEYSPFRGEAVKCTLRIRRIAGFRLTTSRYRWMSTGQAVVWIGRPFPDAPPVPVRLEMDTMLGALRAHLTAAARHADGGVERLGPTGRPGP
jgi:hypothetical protein